MDIVKCAKNGSDVTSAAVKLARAYTGKDIIAICTDHPFFSVDDWFMGSIQMNACIPKIIQGLTLGFQYNNIDSVRVLFEMYPVQIAGVILEGEERTPPENNFLQHLKQFFYDNGDVLIFEEIKTGFRLHLGEPNNCMISNLISAPSARPWETVLPFQRWQVKGN